MEAINRLAERIQLQQYPYTKDWSAAADFLELIVDHVLDKKPQNIVECSSGTSTLMLAQSCAQNKQGKVLSLENGASYAEVTRDFIQRNDLELYACVIDAPLVDSVIAEQTFQWYQLPTMPASIDMLVIDGPPGFIQKNSRLPALPQLMPYLSSDCVVFLDDAARADEHELVAWWLQQYPDFSHQYLDFERGCSVLTRAG